MTTYKCSLLGTLFKITAEGEVFVRNVRGEFVRASGNEGQKVRNRIAKGTVKELI
jgi:hypothetical protein